MKKMYTGTKFYRGGGRGWDECKELFLLNSFLVFNRFLRGPVGTRGFMGGEWGGEFIQWGSLHFCTN